MIHIQSSATETVLIAVFYLELGKDCFPRDALAKGPHFGLPPIPALGHLGQAILQALVLPFGLLAFRLPLVTTPTKESKQLGKRASIGQRFTDRHRTTSM
jgi:hypothetical protein